MKVVQAVADGHMARWRAAELLSVSIRNVRRLDLRFLEDGPSGLVSCKRGRPSHNRPAVDREVVVLGLIHEVRTDY